MTISSDKRHARRTARLAAVQAIYQLEQSETPLDKVLDEFINFRLCAAEPDEPDIIVDIKHFETVVRHTWHNLEKIDQLLIPTLPDRWPINRVESVLRAILRSGIGELIMESDIDPAVTINEFIEVTRAFYARKEPAFVNGILDKVARNLKLNLESNDKKTEQFINQFGKEKNISGLGGWEGEGGHFDEE
ncbi:MAG: transcription antitermination factor NusB [Alphaproteobacteria bacterium]